MRRHVSLRLLYALAILLLLLMPAMALIAAGEGRSGSLPLMLWMVWLVPLLLLLWLWCCRAPEECAGGPRIAVAAAPPDDGTEAKALRSGVRPSCGRSDVPCRSQFLVGVPYGLALLLILGVHQLGHYVVARAMAFMSRRRIASRHRLGWAPLGRSFRSIP